MTPAPSTTRSPLPGGGKLITLHDAANYITKLPKREHDAAAWRAAIEDSKKIEACALHIAITARFYTDADVEDLRNAMEATARDVEAPAPAPKNTRTKLDIDDERRADIALRGFAGKRLTYQTTHSAKEAQSALSA